MDEPANTDGEASSPVDSFAAVMLSDRLLDGGSGDQRLTELVDALRAPAAASELRRLDDTVTSMAGALAAQAGVSSVVRISNGWRRSGLPRRRLVAVAAVAAVMATAGAAGAATGSLPDPVQSRVSEVLEHTGISVPSGEDDGSAAGGTAPSADDTGPTEAGYDNGVGIGPSVDNHGGCVVEDVGGAVAAREDVGETARDLAREGCDLPGTAEERGTAGENAADPATPADAATPADPATPGVPATPAAPAVPADPAAPAVPVAPPLTPTGVGPPEPDATTSPATPPTPTTVEEPGPAVPTTSAAPGVPPESGSGAGRP